MDTLRLHARYTIANRLLTVVGMTGVAALFLPFAFGVSPMQLIVIAYGSWWRVVLPGFLSVFASAASIRWMLSGSFSPVERTIAYVISAAVSVNTLYIDVEGSRQVSGILELSSVILSLATLCFGVYVLIHNARSKSAKELNPIVAIQVAYLAHALFCLTFLFGCWEVGAYFVLVAAGVFFLQIILCLRSASSLIKVREDQ